MYEYLLPRCCNNADVVPKSYCAHQKDDRSHCPTHGAVSTLGSEDILNKKLLLFLTFSALVANPKKLLYTVANHPDRGLLNREK